MPDRPIDTTIADAQRLHRESGMPQCLVAARPSHTRPVVMTEATAIAAGMIDDIVWSTDASEADGIDPALLA